MASNILRTPTSGAIVSDGGTKILKETSVGGSGKIHKDDNTRILRD